MVLNAFSLSNLCSNLWVSISNLLEALLDDLHESRQFVLYLSWFLFKDAFEAQAVQLLIVVVQRGASIHRSLLLLLHMMMIAILLVQNLVR